MTLTFIFIIFILLLVSTFLIIRSLSLIKRMEMLEDFITEYDIREDNTKKALNEMLTRMREIDSRGSFESDDEVGYVFTQLKTIIEEYTND